MAAIGVRGTDFVVRASADTTRVTVQQGAVVMSPFSDGCSAASSGPCSGALARQLTASLAGGYLEQRGQTAPTLIKVEPSKLPGLFAPAREEPSSKASEALLEVLPQASVMPAGQQMRSAPEGFQGSSGIFWGRWDPVVQSALVTGGGYEIIGQSGSFVLIRPSDKGSLVFPGDGRVSFQLEQSSLLLRSADGLVRAEAVSPSLVVNFGARTFETAITLRAAGQSDSMHGRGSLTSDGTFLPNAQRSNADIMGGLSNGGLEAGYVFVRRNADGATTGIGVTRWAR